MSLLVTLIIHQISTDERHRLWDLVRQKAVGGPAVYMSHVKAGEASDANKTAYTAAGNLLGPRIPFLTD
jgi:hypothetical protein